MEPDPDPSFELDVGDFDSLTSGQDEAALVISTGDEPVSRQPDDSEHWGRLGM